MQIWTGSSIFRGQCDFVLMLRLPTWLMRPRSVLTGHWAAGHSGQSQTVGKWLRLRSCDWPKAQRPAFNDFMSQQRRRALIPQWKSKSVTEMIKRVWKNNGDEIRWTWSRGSRCSKRIKVTDVLIVKSGCHVFIVLLHRRRLFQDLSFLPGLKEKWPALGETKKVRAWLNFLCNVIQCHSPLTELAHQMLYI